MFVITIYFDHFRDRKPRDDDRKPKDSKKQAGLHLHFFYEILRLHCRTDSAQFARRSWRRNGKNDGLCWVWHNKGLFILSIVKRTSLCCLVHAATRNSRAWQWLKSRCISLPVFMNPSSMTARFRCHSWNSRKFWSGVIFHTIEYYWWQWIRRNFQNKKVEGNHPGDTLINKKRKYRQYMNRKGGFNRPLDYVAWYLTGVFSVNSLYFHLHFNDLVASYLQSVAACNHFAVCCFHRACRSESFKRKPFSCSISILVQ